MANVLTNHPWHHAETRPDAPALIIADDGMTLSYRELMARANRLSRWFIARGLSEGDTVAFFLENQIRYFELCWAAKNAGLYYVCIPRQSSIADATYIVENSDARVLISSNAQAQTAIGIAERAASRPTLLMMDGAVAPFICYEDAVAGQLATPPHGRRRGGSLLYSSGTTGRPKGVRSPLLDVPPQIAPGRHATLVKEYKFSRDTVLLVPGPFYHTSPLRFAMHAQRAGGVVIGFRKFDAEATLRAIEHYRVTHALLVPTMLVRMLKLPEALKQSVNVSSLQYAIHQAAPCSIRTKEAMMEWWGPILYEMYGGTEGNGQTVIGPHEWLARKGSVGRPAEGVELHILDEHGKELGPHQDGLVYLSNGRKFEYLNDPDKTQAVHHPRGWATLGDIGHVDEEGYLYLTDRQSNLIISGGVNIYPQEAENVLIAHPVVADVAVIGVPNAEFGEEVKAVVVLDRSVGGDDESALANRLIAHCRSELSAIKCPRSVDFVDEIPRSEAGKLLKRELRRRYWPTDSGLVI
jgi:acyl-CoA synthetase (AMP-forming)/AMP-acid ligase II